MANVTWRWRGNGWSPLLANEKPFWKKKTRLLAWAPWLTRSIFFGSFFIGRVRSEARGRRAERSISRWIFNWTLSSFASVGRSIVRGQQGMPSIIYVDAFLPVFRWGPTLATMACWSLRSQSIQMPNPSKNPVNRTWPATSCGQSIWRGRWTRREPGPWRAGTGASDRLKCACRVWKSREMKAN